MYSRLNLIYFKVKKQVFAWFGDTKGIVSLRKTLKKTDYLICTTKLKLFYPQKSLSNLRNIQIYIFLGLYQWNTDVLLSVYYLSCELLIYTVSGHAAT